MGPRLPSPPSLLGSGTLRTQGRGHSTAAAGAAPPRASRVPSDLTPTGWRQSQEGPGPCARASEAPNVPENQGTPTGRPTAPRTPPPVRTDSASTSVSPVGTSLGSSTGYYVFSSVRKKLRDLELNCLCILLTRSAVGRNHSTVNCGLSVFMRLAPGSSSVIINSSIK